MFLSVIATGVVLSALVWLIGFWLLWHIRVCDQGPEYAEAEPETGPPPAPGAAPTLSVIIPARNEEQRLPSLLRSLAEESRPADEIIVVDDHSTDATVSVATAGNAKVVRAGDLPSGWTGKSWACWIGALAATGSLLVFLDADTTLTPDGLAKLVAAHRRRGGLLTVQPYHVTVRAYERLSALLNVVLMMGMNTFTPLGQRVRPDGAFGPCVASNRDDYFRSGGHEAAPGAVLDDYFLGQTFLRAGMPVHCLGGRGTVSFRMYPEGFNQMVEGWSKTFGSGSTGTSIPTLLLTTAWVSGCIGAVLLPVWALIQGDLVAATLAAILYVAYALQIHWMLERIGEFGRWTAAVYPAPLFFLVAICLRALVLIFVMGRVRWKGRDIATYPFGHAQQGGATGATGPPAT